MLHRFCQETPFLLPCPGYRRPGTPPPLPWRGGSGAAFLLSALGPFPLPGLATRQRPPPSRQPTAGSPLRGAPGTTGSHKAAPAAATPAYPAPASRRARSARNSVPPGCGRILPQARVHLALIGPRLPVSSLLLIHELVLVVLVHIHPPKPGRRHRVLGHGRTRCPSLRAAALRRRPRPRPAAPLRAGALSAAAPGGAARRFCRRRLWPACPPTGGPDRGLSAPVPGRCEMAGGEGCSCPVCRRL